MGLGLAMARLERPAGSLSPAQAELRRPVLAPFIRRAPPQPREGARRSLPLAGRPLSRSLLQEWKTGMSHLALSTINVQLAAVRKMIAEAEAEGAIGVEEAARLTGVPNVRQRGGRLGNWLTPGAGQGTARRPRPLHP